MLETTAAGVNNALHRARATIEQQRAAGRLQSSRVVPPDDVERRLVQDYVEAFQARDLRRFAQMLTRDVVLTMPPLPLRYAGREAVTAFYAAVPYASPDDFAFLPTRANRQPAVGVYRLDADIYRPMGIWVLHPDGDAIAEITAFVDPTLPPRFGLPTELGGRTVRGEDEDHRA
jgi:RNA polymerase sigma-70 factor (ECF subfamily)